MDDLRSKEKPEHLKIQTAKELLGQLKPLTKTWPGPHVGPHNFKGKPKLNKKEKISFRKMTLGCDDWMLLGSATRKMNEYVPRRSWGRLLVTCGDKREQDLPTPAVKQMRST